MYYFVTGADGARYGPADIDTLVQWAGEGRVVGSTVLVERGTENQVRADSITAVAAALRRASGGEAGVAIERDEPTRREAPTVTSFPPDRAAVQGPPPLPSAFQAGPGQARRGRVGPKSRVVAGLLGIFLGWLGVHRFYLGYTGIGLLMLALSFFGGVASFACIPFTGCGVVWLWGFIEGIVCLCGGMRDADGLELRD